MCIRDRDGDGVGGGEYAGGVAVLGAGEAALAVVAEEQLDGVGGGGEVGGDGDGLLDGVDGWVGLAEDVVHARSGAHGDL